MESFEMKLSIKNIGKIESADINLDGITVICGENNTGKSTIGKVLFAYFNSMCDFESKIIKQRIKGIGVCASKYSTDTIGLFSTWITKSMERFIFSEADTFTIDDIKEILSYKRDLKNRNALAEDIYSILTTSNEKLLCEYIFRYFMDIFNNQVRNENCNSKQSAFVKTDFNNGTNKIRFYSNKCDLTQEVPVIHCAYYINNPFVIDYLNIPQLNTSALGELERNIIDTINSAQMEQAIDKMTDIFDAVANKDKLEEIKKLIGRAYTGRTIRKSGLYFYHEGEENDNKAIDIDFRNLSTGLKSFALIERLLESGKLKSKDVLILDEPEIHLHPEWQLIYAELIVLLQKTFDLTILLVTHSFHFLESLKFFIDKYDIAERGNFYTPQKSDYGFIITETDDALYDAMKSLSDPSFKLTDMKFEFEMEQDNETD